MDAKVNPPAQAAAAPVDPRTLLAAGPMSRTQVAVVAITVGLCALDGFDVLSISFASPGIAAEWGIDRAALSVVLSMELFGMAVGALALGSLADRMGRRPTMLVCLVLMTIGMFMVTGVKQIAASHPVIALAANSDVELETMVAKRFLGEGDLAMRARLQIAKERIAHCRAVETGRREAMKEDVAFLQVH